MESQVNYLAIVVAAIVGMAVGFVWYGILFKNSWMGLMGYTADSMRDMKMSASKSYLIQFIASLVMAYVLSAFMWLVFASTPGATPMSAGATTGFLAWLGFIGPVSLGVVLWENKPWKLWVINTSHYLVALVLMGIVLSFWM